MKFIPLLNKTSNFDHFMIQHKDSNGQIFTLGHSKKDSSRADFVAPRDKKQK